MSSPTSRTSSHATESGRRHDPALVELEDLPADRAKRTGLVYLSYPNNPPAAVAPRDYLACTVESCREHDMVIAFDNQYVEITYNEGAGAR